MLPDAELVVSQALRADHAIQALTGLRVGTRTPSSFTAPWVRVFLIDDQPSRRSTALHLVEAYLQIDCYAGDSGGQAEASLIGRTVRQALHDIPGATHEHAVVTYAAATMQRAPDDDLVDAQGIPRERYILSATVALHPLPA